MRLDVNVNTLTYREGEIAKAPPPERGLTGRIQGSTLGEMVTGGRNCWEFRACGREPGGRLVEELGVCPAASHMASDGYLGGRMGGRACAYVAGTFCEGTLEGTYHDKSKQCWDCAFYRGLRQEHGPDFSLPAFLAYIGSASRH